MLEGATDDAEWTVLKTHTNDDSIPYPGYGTASWAITGYAGEPVRYLRIRSTGRDAWRSHLVCVGGFEVYGTLYRIARADAL